MERFSAQGFGFIITIVISRLISPADYGLIAMLSIFIAVSQVFIDSGLSNSLIQNQNRTEKDYSTVFLLNIAIGLICYTILFCGAPWVASFYEQPLLVDILRVYALVLIINSLILVQRAIVYIRFQYRKLSLISILSILVGGGIAIWMAYKGYGVWALLSYYLVQSIVLSGLLWITSDWHPHFIFDRDAFHRAFNFGWKILLANILHTIVSNLYTLVIGKKFNAIDLGFYGRGQSIAYVYPSNISNMFNQAVFPVLCELQNDAEKLKHVFLRYILIAALLTFLPLMLLVSLAESFVDLLLGEQWLPAVPIIQILSVGYMLDPIMRLNAIVLNVTGKTKLSLQAEIVKKVFLVMLLFGTMPFGIKWIAVGLACYSVCDLIVGAFFVRQVVDVSLADEVRTVMPVMFASVVLYMIVRGLNVIIASDNLMIFCGLIAAFILGAITARFLKVDIFRLLKL